MATAVTAPLERQFGAMAGLDPDVVESSGGHAVINLRFGLDVEPRRGGADGAGGHQRRGELPAARSAVAAHLQQGQPRRRADPDAGGHVRRPCRSRWCRTGRHPPGPEALAGLGGRAREPRRRPAPAVRIQVNPARSPRTGSASSTVRAAIGAANSNQAKGNFDGLELAYAIETNSQLQDRRRVPQARSSRASNGAPVRLRRRRRPSSRAPRTPTSAAWVERRARHPAQHPAPAGRQRDRGGRSHPRALAASSRPHCPRRSRSTVMTDRTDTIRSSVARRRSSSWCSPWRWS